VRMGLAPLGSGPTDWAHFSRCVEPALSEDSWAILEHVLSKDEGHASIALLRDAAKSAGVAFE